MAKNSGGAKQVDMLFACTNCHRNYKLEQLSSEQHLCKSCRLKCPLVTCNYCRLEFHATKRSASKGGLPVCDHCSRQMKQYGSPSVCVVCTLHSAFKEEKCLRCSHSEKKYGPPVSCENCKNVCAFLKTDDVRKKVGGKTLCLLCTISYKKMQHRKREHSTVHPEERPASSKKIRVNPPSTAGSTLEPVHRSFSSSDTQFDSITTNHLVEMDRLQTEISSLKKQLVQKDQALIEKDKTICALKAESLEKDKKYQSMQKSNTDIVEHLKEEIKNLKRQASASSKVGIKRDKDPLSSVS